MNRCDWNPVANAPAERVAVPVFGGEMKLMDEQRGCRNEAAVIVESQRGNKPLRLCAVCASLPRFDLCSKRPIEAQPLVNQG